MQVHAVNRTGQWASECMFIQKVDFVSGHVSTGTESRVGLWACECRYMQRTEVGHGPVNAVHTVFRVGQWACE